jgi:hypothetical protein
MDLTSKKRYELEQLCRENKIKKFTGLKKSELIELINLNIDKIQTNQEEIKNQEEIQTSQEEIQTSQEEIQTSQEEIQTNENVNEENMEEIYENSDEMIKKSIIIDEEQFYINKNKEDTNEVILYKKIYEDDNLIFEDVGKLIKINNDKCYYLSTNHRGSTKPNINYIMLAPALTKNFELKFIGIQKETIKLELSIDYDIGKKFLDDYYKLKILCNTRNEDLTFKPRRDKKMNDIFNIINSNKNKNKILYHGTSKDNLLSIINRGFALTKKPTNGHRYGPGIYFTDDFDFAKRYAELNENERYIIVCNVYINNICLANPRNDIFPKIHNSEEYYDTGVDKLEMPKQWIKQDTKHIDIIGTYKIIRLQRSNLVKTARNKFGIKIKNCYIQQIHIYFKPETFDLYTGHISECKSMNQNLSLSINQEISISTFEDDEFICGIFINNEFQIIQLIKVEIGKKHYEVKI